MKLFFASTSKITRNRWFPLALWATMMALAVIFLSTSYYRRARIDIIATSESLELKIGSTGLSWSPALIRSLEIIDAEQIEGIEYLDNAVPGYGRIAFEAAGETLVPPATLTLQRVALKGTDTLSIRHVGGTENLFEIIIFPDLSRTIKPKASLPDSTELELISFGSPLKVDIPQRGYKRPTNDGLHSIKVSISGPERIFRFKLAERELVHSEPFQVSAISFLDTISKARPAQFSTIKKASIRFEDIDAAGGKSKEVQFETGALLRIGKLEDGHIRAIRLSNDGIFVNYSGYVLGLWTGEHGIGNNLMPSYLDSLILNSELVAFVTLLVSILGVIAAGLALRDGN